MKKLVLLFLVIFPLFSEAQNMVFLFKGTVTSMDNGKNEAGVSVSFVQNGTTVASATTGTNGKYTLKNNIAFTSPFSVVFSKAGMVSKKVDFNFSTLNEEDVPPGEDYQPLQDLSMSLFAERPNVDFGFLANEPVASFAWNASKMVPVLDKVASEKTRSKIEKILLQSEQQADMNEAKYQAAIKDGDALMKAGKYTEAKNKFNDALKLKPAETYPTSKVKELEGLITAQQNVNTAAQQAETEYQALVKAADALRDQKKYDQAIVKYKEAAAKKNEQYVQDQINSIKKIQDDQKAVEANETKFKEAIAQADNLYNQKKYAEAKVKYEAAKQIKPTDSYTTTRITDIDKKVADLASAEDKKKKVEEAIAAGSSLFSAGKYDEAKLKFNEALALDASSVVASQKVKECEAKLAVAAKEKEKVAKIEKLNAEAETFFNAGKLLEAKTKYTELLSLDPTNSVAKTKIEEINKKSQDATAAAEAKAKLTKLIADADALDKVGKLTESKLKYEEAIAQGADATVQTKLEGVKKKIADQEAKAGVEAKFQNLKTEGMQLAAAQKYAEAKAKLMEANALKADQAIAAKIKEIEAVEKTAAVQGQLDQEYQQLVDQANQKEQAGDIDGALLKFKEAAQKKPSEKLPKDKITELENKKKVALAQKDQDTKYNDLMKKGDDLMGQKRYLEAIKEYNAALAMKPNEKAPSEKAAEAQRLEQEKSQEGDAQYEKIIATAQVKITEKDYVKAKELAERAIKIKPTDQRPKDMLKTIETLTKQERDYKAKITEAEVFVNSKEYKKAIASYEQAKSIKPDETQPQLKIDELTKLSQDQTVAQQKDNQYKDLIKRANVAQASKQYDEAAKLFQSALEVKPDDQLAKSGLSEVNQLLDDVKKTTAANDEKKKAFDEQLAQADAAFTASNFTEAKVLYEKILVGDPKNTTAKKKLEEIAKKEANQLNSQQEAAVKQYTKDGDDAFKKMSYDKAKEAYLQLLELRPTDAHAKKKLAEIDAILNPVVTKSDKLQNLGDVYEDNDITKGYELLLKADIERKNLKLKSSQSTEKDVYEKEEEMSEVTSIQQQRTTQEMAYLTNKIGVDNELADIGRQGTVELIRAKEGEMTLKDRENSNYEHVDALKSQESLNISAQETEQINLSLQGAQEENDIKLKNVEVLVENGNFDFSTAERSSNLNADQRIDQAEDSYESKSIDDIEARDNANKQVKNILVNAANESEYLGKSKSNDLMQARENLEVTAANLEAGNLEDVQSLTENDANLKIIQANQAKESDFLVSQKSMNLQGVNERFDEINKGLVEEGVATHTDGIELTAALHQGNKEMDQLAFENYKKEQLKYLQNESEIDRFTNVEYGIAEETKEKQKQNTQLVNVIDEHINGTNSSESSNDDDQRALARLKMDDLNDKLEDVELAENTDDNIKSLADVNKSATLGEADRNKAEDEKRFSAQDKLNNIDAEKPEKKRIANTLGKDYPEGVSQESFTQKDENGLPTAVITRRVVVINGQGSVYIRTQSLQSITYSKNGEPSTEYIWSKETTGPHLKKNY